MEAEARAVVESLNELARGKAGKEAFAKVWGNYRNTHPQCIDFSDAEFVRVDLSNQDLSRLHLRNARFTGCTLRGTIFRESLLTSALFVSENVQFVSNVANCDFDSAICSEVRFENCRLEHSRLVRTTLANASFKGCNLNNTDFTSSLLGNAKFEKVRFNTSTCFKQIGDVRGMTMSKYEFACLGPEAGQLTVGNQMDMNIIDDTATLRQEFGGVWAVLHLLGLIIFVSPYAWFLTFQWSLAQFSDDASGMTIFEAVIRHVLTGGGDWQADWGDLSFNWISLSCFFLYFAYNFARAFLVWKTKRLETEQEVKGLPVKFSLKQAPWWNACYWFVKVAVYFAVAAVAVNSINFLLVRLPPLTP